MQVNSQEYFFNEIKELKTIEETGIKQKLF